MREMRRGWLAGRLVLAAGAAVCGGFAINQMTLNGRSWPWWVAALVSAAVAAGPSVFAKPVERRTNRATAESGGHASAGDRGRFPASEPSATNEARAAGSGSVARAGDDYGESRPPQARRGHR